MDNDAMLYGSRPRPMRHCVRWGPRSPQNGTAPTQFSVHVYCGKTAGWIKMPLGTEVGLGPGDIVLDGDPVPPKRGTASQFSAQVYCGQRLDGWYGSRPWPRPHCVRWGPSPPSKWAQKSRLFSARVYCGHGRPSQLLLSSCLFKPHNKRHTDGVHTPLRMGSLFSSYQMASTAQEWATSITIGCVP